MHQLLIGDLRRESLGDLDSATFDKRMSIGREEFVQHFARLATSPSRFCAIPYIAV